MFYLIFPPQQMLITDFLCLLQQQQQQQKTPPTKPKPKTRQGKKFQIDVIYYIAIEKRSWK